MLFFNYENQSVIMSITSATPKNQYAKIIRIRLFDLAKKVKIFATASGRIYST
jgi:hypothetical protein